MKLSPQAYEELIAQSVDVVTVLDGSSTIQYQSPSVERVLGYTPEEMIGNSALEYVHPDDRQRVLDAFYEVVRSDKDYTTGRVEYRASHENGSWVWLEGRVSNQTATVVDGYVVSTRDVTARKEYEQKLEREQDRLARFASFVSHDLRNPLSVAEGRLELAREECDSEHLDDVERSLDRMRGLIEDVLTLVREGDVEPVLDAVSIRELAERSWQTVDTKAATLDIETDESVLADERQLQRLLENLMRNGVEHGGDDVTITVGSLDDGCYIEDDGRGIPEDDRERLLEYGFSTKTNGTGLGLSIVNEIVRNHGWSLVITESDDAGARFEITGVEVVD